MNEKDWIEIVFFFQKIDSKITVYEFFEKKEYWLLN